MLHRQAAVQGSCQLVSHVVNTGHGVPNISCIKLQRGDEQIEDVAIGTGPLDASFKAINRMLQMDVKLESFSLNAVTDGEDAIGEAVVKVSAPTGARTPARASRPISSNRRSAPTSTASTRSWNPATERRNATWA